MYSVLVSLSVEALAAVDYDNITEHAPRPLATLLRWSSTIGAGILPDTTPTNERLD